MSDLKKLPYAEWLEQSLQNIVTKPVQSICILTKFTPDPSDDEEDLGDEIGTGYWHASVADKLLFAGFLQQDAMLDTMKANGYIPDDDDEEDEEDHEDE